MTSVLIRRGRSTSMPVLTSDDRESTPKRDATAFYKLIMEIIYYNFYHTLLVTQIDIHVISMGATLGH